MQLPECGTCWSFCRYSHIRGFLGLLKSADKSPKLQLVSSSRAAVRVCSSTSQETSSQHASKLQEKNAMVEEKFFERINLKVAGYDHPVLDSYVQFVTRVAKNLEVRLHGTAALPTRVKKYTVLKSPHIYKKHRVQFETRTHSRLLQVSKITGTTADIFLEYIQRNLPEGVSMSVYQESFEALPSLLVQPPKNESFKKQKKSK